MAELTLLDASPEGGAFDLIVVGVPAGSAAPDALPANCAETYERAQAAGVFRGRAGDELSFGDPSWVVIGVGKAEDVDPRALREFAGRAVRAAESRRRTSVALLWPGAVDADGVQALAEGLLLAAWDFRELKKVDPEKVAPLVERVGLRAPGASASDTEEAVRIARATAEGQNLARRLQNLPGNRMTPTLLGEAAQEMAAEVGLEAEIWGPERLEAERMHALLSVSKGSDEEPRLIILRHRGGTDGAGPVALVGKGLTFDAGGISLKPPQGMEDMKFDMSGGAAVVGAMCAIARANLPINVLGVVASSENLMNGRANKPGDVIDSRKGKTIEVINTDAEGRLILADALAWTVEQGAKTIVDCATLTGSCVIALGHHASGLFSPSESLTTELREAGERSGQRCWPLPVWDVYRKQLDSPVADLKNVGGRPAGSITAARFLQEFVGDTVWAHLDIAGTAYGDDPAPYLRKGGFGVPTRLLFEWVRARSA